LDSELVSSSLSATEGSGHDSSLPHFTYTERFYEAFPYYLSIGMTHEQYWDGDCTLTKYYRKADELRSERRNQELWLQGMYIYEAICDVSPILHAFAKKGTKPHPYTSKPYAISEKQIRQEREERERKVAEKGKRFMEALMQSNNKRFEGSPQIHE
jgi:hypothetical protein